MRVVLACTTTVQDTDECENYTDSQNASPNDLAMGVFYRAGEPRDTGEH